MLGCAKNRGCESSSVTSPLWRNKTNDNMTIMSFSPSELNFWICFWIRLHLTSLATCENRDIDSIRLQVLCRFCTRVDQLGWLSGEHPGGKKSIMMFAGKDATEEFDMLHDRKVIKKYGIDEGTVELKGTIKKWDPRCSHLFAPGRPVWGILEEAADWVRCSWGKTPLRDWDSFMSRLSK